jgi:hypothetical protein
MNVPASWVGVSVLSNEKPVSFPPAASQLLLLIHMIAAPLLVGLGVHPDGDMNLVGSGAGDRKPAPGTQLNQYTPIGTLPVLFSVMLY